MWFTHKRKVFALFALGVLLVCTWLAYGNRNFGLAAANKGDVRTYLRAARRMVEGEEIYFPLRTHAYTYPPFCAFTMIPVAALPRSAHRILWYGVNVVLLAGIALLVYRNLLRWDRALDRLARPRRWVFWLLLLLLCGRHLAAPFANQSNDLVITLLVLAGADASTRLRERASGVWWGLGAATKATPLLFLPVLLWQRRIAASAAILVALVAATLLPDLVTPRDDGQLWVVAWGRSFLGALEPGAPARQAVWEETNILNQNLAGTIYRLSTPVEDNEERMIYDAALWDPDRRVLKAITLLAQGLVLLVVLLATWPRWSRGLEAEALARRRWGEAGAVACGMLLLSPMSSKAHFCLLLLPAAFCLADYLFRRRDRVVLVLLVVSFLTGTLTSKGFLGVHLGDRVLARGPVAWSTLATLAAVARILVREGRSVRAAGGGSE